MHSLEKHNYERLSVCSFETPCHTQKRQKDESRLSDLASQNVQYIHIILDCIQIATATMENRLETLLMLHITFFTKELLLSPAPNQSLSCNINYTGPVLVTCDLLMDSRTSRVWNVRNRGVRICLADEFLSHFADDRCIFSVHKAIYIFARIIQLQLRSCGSYSVKSHSHNYSR